MRSGTVVEWKRNGGKWKSVVTVKREGEVQGREGEESERGKKKVSCLLFVYLSVCFVCWCRGCVCVCVYGCVRSGGWIKKERRIFKRIEDREKQKNEVFKAKRSERNRRGRQRVDERGREKSGADRGSMK
jgi:hypothetical protein